MSYTHYATPEAKTAAAKYARGTFQAALLAGEEAWSAMTVNNDFRSRYVASGDNLRARLEAVGFTVERVAGPNRRREYMIALPAGGVDALKPLPKIEGQPRQPQADKPEMFLLNGRVDGGDWSFETDGGMPFTVGNSRIPHIRVRVHPIYENGSHGLPAGMIDVPYSAKRQTATLSRLEKLWAAEQVEMRA